jgi:hypothetical protein
MGSAVPFTPFRGPNDLTLGVRRGGFDLSFRFLGFPGHGRRGLWRGGQRCRLVHDRPALIAEVIRRRVGRVEIFRSGRWLGNCQRRRAQERRRRCDKDAARPFHNTGMLARHTGVLGAARARRELRWLALRGSPPGRRVRPVIAVGCPWYAKVSAPSHLCPQGPQKRTRPARPAPRSTHTGGWRCGFCAARAARIFSL